MSNGTVNKYDFIQQLLENKKLSPVQRERILALAKEEIMKDAEFGISLDYRVKVLEQSLIKNNELNPMPLPENVTKNIFDEGVLNSGEFSENSTAADSLFDQNNSTSKKLNTKIPQIVHDPQMVYDIFYSFKSEAGKFRFKYLVHGTGSEVNEQDFIENLSHAKEDFRKLKNVPNDLYNSIKSLILAYEKYGIELVKKEEKHPFDCPNSEIKIQDTDLQKLRFIFSGGPPYKEQHFKYFTTAIQNFKKKYRFDTENAQSEASVLQIFLENIVKFQKHNDVLKVYSFDSEKSTENLFRLEQIIFSLDSTAFFAWNPALKKVLSWITESILKHSNIEGSRPFNPDEKKIEIKSYTTDYDDIADHNDVFLEITDRKSMVMKDAKYFRKILFENLGYELKSVCDLEVIFSTQDCKKFKFSLMPIGDLEEIINPTEIGITYKFKFIS